MVCCFRARLICFETWYIIGVRKSGTTDLSRWFTHLKRIYANKAGNNGTVNSGVSYDDNEWFAVGGLK